MPGSKLGHLGTLDPMAGGVLPVAVGYATRVIEYIQDVNKEYQAAMILGGISDTQDAWGKVEYFETEDYHLEQLPSILHMFTGTIEQIPPMFSAVHHQGQRLYELARQGITVEREARQVDIKAIRLIAVGVDCCGRPLVKINVECSAGTYVRTLCHDIGQKLGTGAYLSELIRVRSGVFDLSSAVDVETLEESRDISQYMLKADYPLQHLPELIIDNPGQLYRLDNGNAITVGADKPVGLVRVYNTKRLMAIARIKSEGSNKVLQPLKVLK